MVPIVTYTKNINDTSSANKIAASATLHCLTGCAIGEIAGMVIAAMFSLPNIQSVIFSIALAFVFGYGLSMLPLLKHGLTLQKALKLAFAADTISITVME